SAGAMSTSSSERVPPAPAVLRLVQLAVLGRWRATGEDLYREVVSLAEITAGQEVLVSGCGEGVTTEWIATRAGAAVTGVDPDAERIERAEARARALPTPLPLSYQQAPLDDLPHETAVFDCAVGEPVIAAAADPEQAVSELVRVTKPMGTVVLLQLTWSSELGDAARELLVERLGMRPRLLVEWKQMLRDAGVVEIQVQDWTSGGPGCTARPSGSMKSVAQAESPLTWQQKAQIVGRAWRQWGWRAGALRAGRGAVERETALLRELSRERAIGFQLIKGVKWPHAKAP
ncbi:MAG TPA: methyltransferase domain-containing protein, partial [Gemmatimonadaceae bacterium]|nr:methyltransferase domain-containing protein [Gemmatimonadaceae bacterium]